MRLPPSRKPRNGTINRSDAYGRLLTAFFPFWEAGGLPAELISGKKPTVTGSFGWSNGSGNFTGTTQGTSRLDYGSLYTTQNVYGTAAAPKGCTWLFRVYNRVATGTAQGLLSRNDNNSVDAGWIIGIQTNGGVSVLIEAGVAPNGRVHATTTAIAQNAWSTVMVTYDGVSAGSGGFTAYINGIPQAITQDALSGLANGSDATSPFYIGSSRWDINHDFDGLFDYVAIFSGRILGATAARDLHVNPWRMVTPAILDGYAAGNVTDESITDSATTGCVFSPQATAAAAITAAVTAGDTEADSDAVSITTPATAGSSFAALATANAAITGAATAGCTILAPETVHESVSAPVTATATVAAHLHDTDSITSPVTAGCTFVDGATRQITVGPSDPPPQSAAPTVVGGDQSMQLSIGGVDLKAYHKEESCSIESQTIGRWTAHCELFDSTGTVAALFAGANGGVGLSIVIQEYGYKLFAGCIQSVVCQRYLGTTAAMTFWITATDKSGICDRRVVTKTNYLSTEDAADVIRSIVQNYLNGEGITTVNVPASLGVLGSDLPFNFQTVRNAFDQIATLTATVWWIDVNGDLHFSTLLNLPAAPFALSETSANWRGIANSLGIQVTTSLQDFRNKQYAVSNLNLVPASGSTGGPQRTETYVIGANGQAAAFAAGLPFGYILVDLPIAAVVSLKINGVAKNVYDINNPASPPYGSGPNDWYYYQNGQVLFPSFVPSVSDSIEIIYVPKSTNVSIEAGTALVPVTTSLGVCGSGLYEAVEQVQDISIREDLDAIAAAVLAKAGGVPIDIQYEVIQHGLQPGQLQDVNIPLSTLTSKQLLITAVAGRSVGSTLGFNCTFRWIVTARSNQDPGNWVKYFERFIRRTEQAKPIVQIEPTTFILGSGSSVSAGIASTNPAGIKQPGQLYRMTIAASDPPQDQDLVVTFTVNNLPVGSITLPAGSTANIFIVQLFDPTFPAYVYKDDAVNVNLAYTNIGASPVAARNVTATMEHTV